MSVGTCNVLPESVAALRAVPESDRTVSRISGTTMMYRDSPPNVTGQKSDIQPRSPAPLRHCLSRA